MPRLNRFIAASNHRSSWCRCGSAAAAEQQIERAGTAMAWLSRRDCQDLPAQFRLLEPPRDRGFEDPRSVRTEPSSGNDEDATPAHVAGGLDEDRERAMGFGLGHSVQVEARLDGMATPPQPFGIGSVDPGKVVERRQWDGRWDATGDGLARRAFVGPHGFRRLSRRR